MIPRRAFDPRSVAGIAIWLDDAQSAGQWSARIGPSAVQNATNNQPVLTAYRSRPALSFDGINDTLAMPTMFLSAWHAFAVVNPAVSTVQTALYIAASSTQSFSLKSSATGWRVISTSGGPTTTAAFYASDSRVGGGWDGGALKGFYKGSIGEVLVYNAALSSSQEAAVSRYLAAKWGL